MEHRLGARHSIRTAVVLHARGLPPLIAVTREVSVSGMFIETQASLGEMRVLDVELTIACGQEPPRHHRWRAMVVRQTEDGIGVTFDRLRPPAVRLLLDEARVPEGNVGAAALQACTPAAPGVSTAC